MGRGHGGGAQPPPKKFFYGRAEIHASFGQSIKISEKLCYVQKNFCMCAKITRYKGNFFWYVRKIFCICLRKVRDIRENALVCTEIFLYVCENYGVLGKIFLVCQGKIFWWPPARQKFWGEILISHGWAN
jgi:hypothetical protein